MEPQQHISNVVYRIAEGTPANALDVFGPTVEFLRWPDDPGAEFCVMRGVVPPGVAVPLHSHADAEDFFLLSDTQQVLTKCEQGLQWRDVNAGDYVHIPAGVPHAHRNVSDEPAGELVVTTSPLRRFFQEIAPSHTQQPPTPAEHAEVVPVATRYRHDPRTPGKKAARGPHPGLSIA